LVYFSSIGAYSPADGREIGEDWPTDGVPTAAYGREKAAVERVLDAVEAGHPALRVVRFRPGFMFQSRSGPQQRRLFAGPLLPTSLLRPGRLPLVPFPAGLRLQVLATEDAARACRLALHEEVRGAFNLAAEPLVDGPGLAAVLGGRPLPVPPSLVRLGLAAAWRAHLVPAEPALFDLAMRLPVMRTERARHELGWVPRTTATEALATAVASMGDEAGGATGPLAPDRMSDRLRQLLGGIGRRP
ncbi:MAG TPA: hypothetical protein VHW47_00250, partial [Acidimicrobiales bacterium]|nr:hypothetical protein [Acidimicrobiales bacterium]